MSDRLRERWSGLEPEANRAGEGTRGLACLSKPEQAQALGLVINTVRGRILAAELTQAEGQGDGRGECEGDETRRCEKQESDHRVLLSGLLSASVDSLSKAASVPGRPERAMAR
jgi:hypothetical protein